MQEKNKLMASSSIILMRKIPPSLVHHRIENMSIQESILIKLQNQMENKDRENGLIDLATNKCKKNHCYGCNYNNRYGSGHIPLIE
jgi:hypothetical protein